MKAGVGQLPVGVSAGASPLRRRCLDYVALAKPRLNLLVIATTAVGFYVASPRPLDLVAWVCALVGSGLVAGGAAGLNQVYERHTDGLMVRTRLRPLPDRRLSVGQATTFSVILAGAGLGLLAFTTNAWAAGVALATLVIYIWVYTPLKARSTWATLVGAVPGAFPPLIGWAAARGDLAEPAAWALFAVVFFWQIPHFFAIAWLYRDDYGKAGFPMLPVIDPDGRRTGRQAVWFAAWLVPASLSLFWWQLAQATYAAGALALSGGLVFLAWRFAADRSNARARALFYGSLLYLPALWALLIMDLA